MLLRRIAGLSVALTAAASLAACGQAVSASTPAAAPARTPAMKLASDASARCSVIGTSPLTSANTIGPTSRAVAWLRSSSGPNRPSR